MESSGKMDSSSKGNIFMKRANYIEIRCILLYDHSEDCLRMCVSSEGKELVVSVEIEEVFNNPLGVIPKMITYGLNEFYLVNDGDLVKADILVLDPLTMTILLDGNVKFDYILYKPDPMLKQEVVEFIRSCTG